MRFCLGNGERERLTGGCGVVGSLVREMSEQASARAKAVGLWRWEWVAECERAKGGVSRLVRLYPHLGRAVGGIGWGSGCVICCWEWGRCDL